jgi:hypothetical protein
LLFVLLSVVALGTRCDGNGIPVERGGVGGGGGGVSGCVGTPTASRCASARQTEYGFVQCSDVLQATVCDNGSWVCPNGTVSTEMCDCYQQCGTAGRPGAGGAGGAGGKGIGGSPPDSGSSCDGPVGYCVVGFPSGNGGWSCEDAAYPATCTNGAWVCPDGTYHVNAQCTCRGPIPGMGCTCTASGWSCTADGGVDAVPVVDSGPVVDATPVGDGSARDGDAGAGIPCGSETCFDGFCKSYIYLGDGDGGPTTYQSCSSLPVTLGCASLCSQVCLSPYPYATTECSCDGTPTTVVTCKVPPY